MASTWGAGTTGTAKVTGWTDSFGNPAKIDGTPKWSSSDDTILTVEADSTDPNLANLASVGPVGTAQVFCKADADLGQGVKTITAIGQVTIIAGEAVAGTIEIVAA